MLRALLVLVSFEFQARHAASLLDETLKDSVVVVDPVRRVGSIGFAVLFLAAASLAFLMAAPKVEASGQIQEYMSGLNWPIALAFAPDGRIFVAQRNTGSIYIIQNNAFLPTPYYTLPNTSLEGERGLLGLALDPDFPTMPYVYGYQTYNDTLSGTIYNRIVRISGSGNSGTSNSTILRLPNLSGATIHNGGVIAFGPDKKLYAVVGEDDNPAHAQDPASPMGKVLRMNTDGSPPADNPFYGNVSWNPLVYTYGHRNMFGLAFHPVTGRVYVTENGPACNDEINLLTPGRNYGWGPTNTCSTPPPAPNNTNQDGPSPVLPIWWWASTICPTNAAIYGGPYFPAFRGDLFMGTCNPPYNFHRLDLVPPNYDTVVSDTPIWVAPDIILDVKVGPDGAIWITTPSAMYRYWDSGRPPVASFTATPNPIIVGATVTLDASASADPDGQITSYAWNFGDLMFGSGQVTSHSYTAVGTYNVSLTVTDNESFTSIAYRDVVVQTVVRNRAPTILTSTPSLASVTVNAGSTQAFSVSGSDPDGDALTYTWRVNGIASGGGTNAFDFSESAPGTYTVNVTVSDGSLAVSHEWTVTVVASPSFLSSAWPFTILAVVVIVVGAGLLIWWTRRRRQREQPPPPST